EPTAVPVINNLSNVAMYPNPVEDVLTIKTDKEYDKLTIINSVGQTVMQQTLQNKETRVNVKTLAPGMYYIMLKNADGVKVEKIEKL
ncbi:MAG: T9SS type A sorting domain-containing protein, partial [Bacteroidetes bacterium]|nr:T9SS type A sorting domain-containing protein [Bacteroidota bacterium]